jgi:hypothetical protein
MRVFSIKYVIWQKRINYGSGWEPLEDRGVPHGHHEGHVHISFEARLAAGRHCRPVEMSGSVCGTPSVAELLTQLVHLASWICGWNAVCTSYKPSPAGAPQRY